MTSIVDKGLLYDFYGALLTVRQRELYECAVYHDMSLAEIAEDQGISRQAVSDLLQRTTKTLSDYEEKLGLIGRFSRINGLCDEIDQLCGEKTHAAGTVRRLTKRIREEL